MWFPIVVTALVGYLLGNLNGAVCMSNLVAHEDVRNQGSGNAGLTNFIRNYGAASSLSVILIDGGKAALACLAGGLMLDPYGMYAEGMAIGGLAVMVGHDFPALLGFRGGKGILCGLTVAIVLDWRIALVILGVFVLAFAITRYVSLGSVLASAAFSICFALLHYDNIWIFTGGVGLGLLALFMHRGNILRLIRGTESKVHLIHRDLNKQ